MRQGPYRNYKEEFAGSKCQALAAWAVDAFIVLHAARACHFLLFLQNIRDSIAAVTSSFSQWTASPFDNFSSSIKKYLFWRQSFPIDNFSNRQPINNRQKINPPAVNSKLPPVGLTCAQTVILFYLCCVSADNDSFHYSARDGNLPNVSTNTKQQKDNATLDSNLHLDRNTKTLMITKHFIIMKKLIPIIAVFFFFSCRKDIIKVDKNYEGDWVGTPDTSRSTTSDKYALLKIDSQSNLSYQSWNSIGEHDLNFGGTAKVKGNDIHVKGILFGHSFTIISAPTQINASNYHWTMTLKSPEGWTMPYYKK